MSITAAQHLATFVAGTQIDDIPDHTVATASLHVLDLLGCALGAYGSGEVPFAKAAILEKASTGPSTGLGLSVGLPSEDAAFYNGILGHSLDLDDTHPGSGAHVSAVVVPAVLAAGQAANATGADVMAALIAGYETVIRVGSAARVFHARGFHPTSVCGIFGATAAASRVRGLSAEQTAHALGMAGSMASGLMEYLSDGTQTKKMHAGWAAQSGVAAARFAAHGGTGPASVFEGPNGFYGAYLHGIGGIDLMAELDDLGSRWRTDDIAYKPYPACHLTHAPMEALAEVMQRESIAASDIVEIVGLTDEVGERLVGFPLEDKRRPRTPYEAKFSLPYCLASMAIYGQVDLATFSPEAIRDERVLDLSARVSYALRPYGSTPDSIGGGVIVKLRDGRELEQEVLHQRGGVENPMTEDEIRTKYRASARVALRASDADVLERSVLNLSREGSLDFLQVLTTAQQAAGQLEPA